MTEGFWETKFSALNIPTVFESPNLQVISVKRTIKVLKSTQKSSYSQLSCQIF